MRGNTATAHMCIDSGDMELFGCYKLNSNIECNQWNQTRARKQAGKARKNVDTLTNGIWRPIELAALIRCVPRMLYFSLIRYYSIHLSLLSSVSLLLFPLSHPPTPPFPLLRQFHPLSLVLSCSQFTRITHCSFSRMPDKKNGKTLSDYLKTDSQYKSPDLILSGSLTHMHTARFASLADAWPLLGAVRCDQLNHHLVCCWCPSAGSMAMAMKIICNSTLVFRHFFLNTSRAPQLPVVPARSSARSQLYRVTRI